MTKEMDGQVSLFGLDTWSGKTCPEPSVQTAVKTSKPSSRKSSGSSNRKLPMFLCLTKDGQWQDASALMTIRGASRTRFTMPSTGASLNAENGSASWQISTETPKETYSLILNCGEKPLTPHPTKLSQVLEQNPDPKYRLSAKACQGILTRAAKRGKGALIQTEKSGTLSCNNDHTLFFMDSIGGNAESYVEADKCGTLKATHYKMPPAIYAAVFDGNMGAKAGNIGYEEEKAPTLNAGKVMDVASFEPGIAGRCGGHCYDDVSGTLRANAGYNQMAVAYNIGSYASNAWLSDNPHSGVYEADQSKTLDAINCGYPGCNQGGTAVVEPIAFAQNQRNEVRDLGGKAGALAARSGMKQQTFIAEPTILDMAHPIDVIREHGDVVPTLTSRMGTGGNNVPLLHSEVHCMDVGFLDSYEEQAPAGLARQYKDPPIINVAGLDIRNRKENGDLSGTLQSKSTGGYSLNYTHPVRVNSIVRRLTPLECTRLQGFPDNWVDIGDWVDSKGKAHKDSDSAKYKALGNSIALPFWDHLLAGISFEYDRIATLGSLFDGIGGFPYCWEIYNGKGTARWASEIEEFPIAVTKIRFGEE